MAIDRIPALWGIWDWLSSNWQLALAFVTATAAALKYFQTRRTELAWKKTEFLFAQAQYLDTEPVLSQVTLILEGRHPSLSLGGIFDDASQMSRVERDDYRQKFDKLLNFYQRLAYAVLRSKTISEAEVAPFSWYLELMMKEPLLVHYCDKSGFHDLPDLARKLHLAVSPITPVDAQAAEQLSGADPASSAR